MPLHESRMAPGCWILGLVIVLALGVAAASAQAPRPAAIGRAATVGTVGKAQFGARPVFALRQPTAPMAPITPRPQHREKVGVKSLSEHRVLLLVLQVAVLLLAARSFGEVMRRLGQPAVLGQLLAGVVLGHSVLGLLFPDLTAIIFPMESTQSNLLEVVSWIGVLFLLMLTGLETDVAMIKKHGSTVLWTSLTGVLTPFLLGVAVAYIIPSSLLVTPEQRGVFAVFMGAALSVSSVPVVARILAEMALLRRNIGQLILATSLAHDTMGWLILSVVASLASSGTVHIGTVAKTLAGTVAFTVFMATLGRRWCLALLRWIRDKAVTEYASLTAVVVLMLLSAAVTQFIGVHAVLGAFLIGVLLSGSPLVDESVTEPLEAVTLGIFAPIFFGAAGLYVDLGVVFQPPRLYVTLLVVMAACAGKILGCYPGARWGRLGRWEAISLGIGANARGAMGLVIAILGLSLNILSVSMFSIVVVMAIVTTAMTPPLLRWSLGRLRPDPEEQARLNLAERQAQSFLRRIRRVLLPAGGGPHARFATIFARALGQFQLIDVTALHVETGRIQQSDVPTPAVDSASPAPRDGKDVLSPITALTGGPQIHTTARVVRSADASTGILDEAARGYHLLVVGCQPRPGIRDTVFGATTDEIVRMSPCPVLVVRAPFVERPAIKSAIVERQGGAECDTASEDGAGTALDAGSGARNQDGAVNEPVLRRSLLPVSGGLRTADAAELVMALARFTGASVTALNVNSYESAPLFWHSGQQGQLRNVSYETVEQIVAMAEPYGVEVNGIVRTAAHAAPEIVAAAEEIGADMILMSGSPRPARRLFFGGTIAHVLAHARCAVAVLRPG